MATARTTQKFAFDPECAVLHLDLMQALVSAVQGSPAGDAFLENCSKWVDAVHAMPRKPLTIFTTLYWSNAQKPELGTESSPFGSLINSFELDLEKGATGVQIDPGFLVDDGDIVLQKTRLYAGMGNQLEQILRVQRIKTVIISGMTLTGVILSTVYRLLDLDYTIYVIYDNVLQIPSSSRASELIFKDVLPSINVHVISLEEALEGTMQD